LNSATRHLQKYQQLLALAVSVESGVNLREAQTAIGPAIVRHFYHYAGWAELRNSHFQGWKPVGNIKE